MDRRNGSDHKSGIGIHYHLFWIAVLRKHFTSTLAALVDLDPDAGADILLDPRGHCDGGDHHRDLLGDHGGRDAGEQGGVGLGTRAATPGHLHVGGGGEAVAEVRRHLGEADDVGPGLARGGGVHLAHPGRLHLGVRAGREAGQGRELTVNSLVCQHAKCRD